MVVVQMHGEPGSGKSTVASALGRVLPAVVLDKDILKSALLGSGLDDTEAGPAAYEVFWAIAEGIARQGHSLVLDSPAYWPAIHERSRAVADATGAAYAMIECVCADRVELKRRLETRDGLPSQPREPYQFDESQGTVEPTCERLVLDTTRPLSEIVDEAIAYVRAGVTS